ncbi:hypothetical protein EDM80_01380 [bacterium]|nr:MAG: hypothetical protein EDM80_01380 [bacterium]RIK62113.1 MAG: hypothetical protein DCC64_11415 [Planctomycetota bacterium]
MRPLLLALLCCGSLLAQERSYESAFGENTLARCDVILHATASAVRKSLGGAISVDLTVQDVIWGEEKAREVKLIYTDKTLLKERESVEGLFALKVMAGQGYSPVGRPVVLSDSDGERSSKFAVCRAFIELEQQAAGEERLKAFEDLLAYHLSLGGYPGRNAAVELMLWVARKPGHVTRERFDRFKALLAASSQALDNRTRQDVQLALQGMVETRLKNDCFREARRGKAKADRVKAVTQLAEFVKDYPRAFVEADAKLADALAKECQDGATARTALEDIASEIRRELRARQIEEEARRAEEEERVRHAQGDK